MRKKVTLGIEGRDQGMRICMLHGLAKHDFGNEEYFVPYNICPCPQHAVVSLLCPDGVDGDLLVDVELDAGDVAAGEGVLLVGPCAAARPAEAVDHVAANRGAVREDIKIGRLFLIAGRDQFKMRRVRSN